MVASSKQDRRKTARDMHESNDVNEKTGMLNYRVIHLHMYKYDSKKIFVRRGAYENRKIKFAVYVYMHMYFGQRS